MYSKINVNLSISAMSIILFINYFFLLENVELVKLVLHVVICSVLNHHVN